MWITDNIKQPNNHLPIFYKKFKAEKALKKCLLKISALGIFSIRINGFKISDYFMPGWTNYNEYVNLCHYDLTGFITKDNLLEVTLADGWYSGRLGYVKRAKIYGDINALYAELDMEFFDGETRSLQTDNTWKVGKTNVLSSSFFDGEEIDFNYVDQRKYGELPSAKRLNKEIRFEKYDYEPVKRIGELFPTVIYQDKNLIRLDFHQNMVGFTSFTVKGKKGNKVTVKHAEVLNGDGSLYYENLRSVRAINSAYLSGNEDLFEPQFTFQGFRYVEIFKDGDTEISNIKGVVLSQEIDYDGNFECSDEIVNKIFSNALWGQKGNFISIPMDCPQRDERLGWTGDAQVFCNTAMFNADCNKFFANYLRLIQTDILPDGKIPSFVPFFIPVSVSTAGVPGWADSICVIPYVHYLHYGDKNVLKENLPYAVKHLNYYLSKCDKNYLLNIENAFGDWLSVRRYDDIDAISQCFLGLSSSLISKTYAILGDEENAKKYQEIFQNSKKAFRDNYLINGKIKGDSQTIYALSLSVGFVSADEIKESFVKSIRNADWKLTTGFIGVKYLLPALCEIGEVDLAYKIIKQTEYPSWGYTIEQGATTIWERWNGYTRENGFETPTMNSFNHYSLGSCVEWLYSHVLGVKLLEDGRVLISPSLSKCLDFARGECMTRSGKVRVEWEFIDNKFRLKVENQNVENIKIEIKDKNITLIEKTQNTIIIIAE
ncbi:MAG: family 78 glycoside hydrolase catalytic domain [Clostridia bacterium]|nr:family 78 glycoside hydrolase catalytic domain [Clostridia bacterium]